MMQLYVITFSTRYFANEFALVLQFLIFYIFNITFSTLLSIFPNSPESIQHYVYPLLKERTVFA